MSVHVQLTGDSAEEAKVIHFVLSIRRRHHRNLISNVFIIFSESPIYVYICIPNYMFCDMVHFREILSKYESTTTLQILHIYTGPNLKACARFLFTLFIYNLCPNCGKAAPSREVPIMV
jgi:hypothetical protein